MSCICSVVHVELFCDLNNTPVYGCLSIGSFVLTSNLPISPTHTLYALELDINTKQYSLSGLTYTGCGKVNLVEVVPSLDVVISAGYCTDSALGKIFCVGYPLLISLIEHVIGIPPSSFVLK